MNAVEIEEAISQLAEQPFDAAEFPYQFLEAFGNKETTLKRLRPGKGSTNKSDLPAGMLQRNNIHLAVCEADRVGEMLNALRDSPATSKWKVKFILATDGQSIEAENTNSGETMACDFVDLGNRFGPLLELAGITTVKQILENTFDIKATGRLNKLYVELLKHNPEWDVAQRREELNHFFARLIFCFFAEDTGIFHGDGLFTATIQQMTAGDGSNTAMVMSEIFRAMNTNQTDPNHAELRSWAGNFPYVNGGLFIGSVEVPKFSKIARSYLLHIGSLDWTKINPDIFGSMIQAVADDEERGALGMHYTSVPNILKVLNPLFLDDLRQKLAEAGDNSRKLLNLRKRLARIRVFDPACGSGNFLVIAYKQMREIEATINERRGEPSRRSDIPLTNLRGIELRHFAVEIARLALIIAEFQCDELYLGKQQACLVFLPLEQENWITHGNALRLDWLSVCPPTGTGVKLRGDDLFNTPLDQTEMDFENEGGETYICGNPPYKGSQWQTPSQRADLGTVCSGLIKSWKSLDYVAAWFVKAASYGQKAQASAALVSTNSICQGQQVGILWPYIFSTGHEISFAHTSFEWKNLASHNAGVTVVIVGIDRNPQQVKNLFIDREDGDVITKDASQINAYLIAAPNILVQPLPKPLCGQNPMMFGNHPYYASPLILSRPEARSLVAKEAEAARFIRPFYGSKEFASSSPRKCLWIDDNHLQHANNVPEIAARLEQVVKYRVKATKDKTAQKLAATPHRFREQYTAHRHTIIVPRVSAESRNFHPVGILPANAIVQEKAFAMYDAPVWNIAIIGSRLHRIWINTVCVRLRTDPSYSNTLGWNTFPVPLLTEKNQADLTRCAEDILLVRERHFPKTIAELYDPEAMPADLREAHDRNDETLERIYIGRRFKNDTERLEKLFEMYTDMTRPKTAKEKK